MGHYDDCYAADDWENCTDKSEYFRHIAKELHTKGFVEHTLDTMYGHAVQDFRNRFPTIVEYAPTYHRYVKIVLKAAAPIILIFDDLTDTTTPEEII